VPDETNEAIVPAVAERGFSPCSSFSSSNAADEMGY
jgi:hypothetical protein